MDVLQKISPEPPKEDIRGEYKKNIFTKIYSLS